MALTFDAVKNLVKVTVSIGYDAVATSIVLNAGQGAKLPATPFNVTWWNNTDFADPADDPNVEIVRVTNVATDTLTVVRGQESITATTKNTAGKTYLMQAGITAQVMTQVETSLTNDDNWIGTLTSSLSSTNSVANEAQSIAIVGTTMTALESTWIGTLNNNLSSTNSTADEALSIAIVGTTMTALETTWIGSLNTEVGLNTTWIGTASVIATAGSNLGWQAVVQDGTTLHTQGGTITGSLTVAGWGSIDGNLATSNIQFAVGSVPYNPTGTIAYDFTGPSLQTTTVAGPLFISAINPIAGRVMNVLLQKDATGAGRALKYNSNFTFYGSNITSPAPTGISANNIFLQFFSMSAALNGVVLVASIGQPGH